MTDVAIRVENLSKQYRIGGRQAGYKTLRETLTDAVTAPFRRLSCVFSRSFYAMYGRHGRCLKRWVSNQGAGSLRARALSR